MATQGEADYLNRREMQRQGIDRAKKDNPEKYAGRPPKANAEVVNFWRSAHNATIAETAEEFQLGRATVARYWAARETA